MNFNIFFINVSSGKYKDLIQRFKEALGINENINKEDLLSILHSYNKKEYYRDKCVIEDYNNGHTIENILKKYNIGKGKMSNILERNGVKRERVKRKVEVVCINDLKIYNSAKEAALSVGLKNSGLYMLHLKTLIRAQGKIKKEKGFIGSRKKIYVINMLTIIKVSGILNIINKEVQGYE